MIWVQERPMPIVKDFNKYEMELNELVHLHKSEGSIEVLGPRSSGKTEIMGKLLSLKPQKERALVVMSWTTERDRWKKIVSEARLENVVVHSPDSLAMFLINTWGKRESKNLEWVEERIVNEHQQGWIDAKSYAETMIAKGKITIGIAHWLLQNEIENFILKGMVPRTDLLCMDEPHEWEPEAFAWIKHLPNQRKLTSQRWATSNRTAARQGNIVLEGVIDNKNLYKQRWLEILEKPPRSWKGYTMISPKLTLKKKHWCKRNKIPTRTIEQTKGRNYLKLWLECLPINQKSKDLWGNKSLTEQKLDLLASRGPCFSYINMSKEAEGNGSIPLPKKDERFLTWEP
jgi:hypothetical protein